ncbi:MAG TPA: hypothetical protein VGQ51_02980 [Puia sp.]|jgi:hypothetical protein|nr:hypothetical protein [Puia sp.]
MISNSPYDPIEPTAFLGSGYHTVITLRIRPGAPVHTKRTVLSILIAVPIAYYAMRQWLQGYSYRAPLSVWIFVSAGVGILAVTLATVSYQSIKAARMNPVKSLRSE